MKFNKSVVCTVIILAIITITLIFNIQSFRLQLWPGPEGLDAGVVAYQTKFPTHQAGVYYTDEPLPTGDNPSYEWTQWPTVDPYNTLIAKTNWFWSTGYKQELLVERRTPTRDTLLESRKIEYWIPMAENEWKKVVGTVVPWVFEVQIALKPGSGSDYTKFNDGEAVWFGIGTKKWDKAYPDPDNQTQFSHAGWSIPLAVYIEKYDPYGYWSENDKQRRQIPKSEWVTECVQITPDLDGRTITLFQNPETPVSLDEVWYQGNLELGALNSALGMLNETVALNPYPDTDFASHAYFKFTFSNFQPKAETDWLGQTTALWFPSVIYRLRVYYLELGTFIYTQKQDELPDWEPREWQKMFTPYKEWWDSFFATFGVLNPFGVFGAFAPLAAFLFTFVVIGIILLILLLIFAPSFMVRLVRGGKRVHHAWKEES